MTISAALKERTKPQHVNAERHPLQQGAVRGTLEKRVYAAYAAQLRHLHVALEAGIAANAAREPRLSRVFQPHCQRVAAFDADLQLLDPQGSARETLPAAHNSAEWIAGLAASQPIALLGVLYVVEGSTNGGKFIAPVLRRAWGWQDGQGLQSLDPHGDRVHGLWAQFRAAIDSLQITDQEHEAIVAAAAETFDAISRSMDEVTALTAAGA